MDFQLGDLAKAKENALKAVGADSRDHAARAAGPRADGAG
jgi:hypothetical protein